MKLLLLLLFPFIFALYSASEVNPQDQKAHRVVKKGGVLDGGKEMKTTEVYEKIQLCGDSLARYMKYKNLCACSHRGKTYEGHMRLDQICCENPCHDNDIKRRCCYADRMPEIKIQGDDIEKSSG